MIKNEYFVINFNTREESKYLKVPFKFEEASILLEEFIDSIKKENCDYWINHKLVYHNNFFIHQFDIFESSKSDEYNFMVNYEKIKNHNSTPSFDSCMCDYEACLLNDKGWCSADTFTEQEELCKIMKGDNENA